MGHSGLRTWFFSLEMASLPAFSWRREQRAPDAFRLPGCPASADNQTKRHVSILFGFEPHNEQLVFDATNHNEIPRDQDTAPAIRDAWIARSLLAPVEGTETLVSLLTRALASEQSVDSA